MKLDAVLTPAEIAALTPRRLRGVTCVVIDALRATSTMITALAHGAEAIIPVASIAEALALRRTGILPVKIGGQASILSSRPGGGRTATSGETPDLLLAGERGGFKIRGFDLGNSPREMTARRVRGRTLAMTTTNGTVALRACAAAPAVYVASILNLPAMNRILATLRGEILFVCAGTHDRFALEDAVCAGAMIASLSQRAKMTTCAQAALAYYHLNGENFWEAFQEAENGQRLLSIRSLAPDVDYCTQIGRHNLLVQFSRGRVVATSTSRTES